MIEALSALAISTKMLVGGGIGEVKRDRDSIVLMVCWENLLGNFIL